MRRLVYYISFLLLSAKTLFAQISLLNTGTSSIIYPLSVMKNNVAIYALHGYVSKSYDECESLSPMPVPGPIGNWNFYQRIDTFLTYALSVDYNNSVFKVYKSTNGGQSWVKKLDTAATSFRMLSFYNATDGVIAGTLYQILYTNDGGNTWSANGVSNPYPVASVMKTYGDSLLCIGGPNFGIGGLSVSKNRGATWTGGFNFGGLTHPRDVAFLNKDTLIAIALPGQDGMGPYAKNYAISFNGGKNWNGSPLPLSNPYSVFFVNSKEGYVLGSDEDTTGMILKTTDLGRTWTRFDTQIRNVTLTDIKFLNDSLAIVSGSGGTLFKWNYRRAVFTGIGEAQKTLEGISLYPNPVLNKLSIKYDKIFLDKLSAKLFNSIGQLILQTELTPENSEIDLSTIPTGLYFIRFQNTNGQRVERFIKK